MKDISFTLRSAAVPADATVLAFRGTERISAPYVFDVVFRTTDSELDGLGSVGEPVTLTVQRAPENLLEAPKHWTLSGVIAALEWGSHEGDHALYLLRFTPKMALLSLSEHSRVFTDVTVPEVLAAVLKDEGIPTSAFRLELDGEYEKREHISQYRESSLDFVHRLMEKEGIFYFFEQGEDGETLVLVDDFSRYMRLDPPLVRFVPRGGDDVMAGDAFTALAHERAALPGRIMLKDYDELNPGLEISSEGFVQEASPRVVDYGEHLITPDGALRYARLRAQIAVAQEERLLAKGGVIGLPAGGTFPLQQSAGSLPSDFLAIEIEHAGVTDSLEQAARDLLGVDFSGGYRTDAVLIPADTQFRAPHLTPWPKLHGVEPAVIDGPASSPYAQIDAHGRYKVRLLFDEGDLVDGSRSTWVRMLEPHGGAPDGFHFPLRKGTEVQIVFLNGDPDRPVILGVSPNVEKPAVVTSGNSTKNILKTGGDNLWELEDQAGAQKVLMSTPPQATHLHLGSGAHQMELRTDGNGLLHYGQDLDVAVGAQKTETVASDLTETYRSTHALSVTGPSQRTLQTSWTQNVLGPVTNTVLSTFTESVTGAVTETYLASLSTHAVGATTITDDGSLTHTVSGGLAKETISSSRTTTVGATGDITVSGAVTETYGATTRNVHGGFTETVTGTYTIKAPKMLVYAGDASIVDQGINALESGVSWLNGFLNAHYDDGTSITGAAAYAAGIELKVAGYGSHKTFVDMFYVGLNIDAAAVRVLLDGTFFQTAGIKMAMKALHIII
ncbi:MAG: type VI secretion system tip protein VgrG [Polyangiaceae bacterium]|nr:type VI secretion system tip protein VgrG [Polyangiaceae bacterium]